MQSSRKGEWPAITKVKAIRSEIYLIALGQGLLHLEAGSAAHDNGERISGGPGSQTITGYSTVQSETRESHAFLPFSLKNFGGKLRKYPCCPKSFTYTTNFLGSVGAI